VQPILVGLDHCGSVLTSFTESRAPIREPEFAITLIGVKLDPAPSKGFLIVSESDPLE
jgi:hypothetical protein